LDDFGDDFTVLFYSGGAGAPLGLELPLIVGQSFGGLLDAALIFYVREVGAVTAAALYEFGGGSREHTLATGAKNARPVAFEEGYVEHPRALALGVLKADPFVGVSWNRSHNETIVGVNCAVTYL
jgi:hypothetical protein